VSPVHPGVEREPGASCLSTRLATVGLWQRVTLLRQEQNAAANMPLR